MKKTILFVLILIMLVINIMGCDQGGTSSSKEESSNDFGEMSTISYESLETPPDNPVVLIGGGMLSSGTASDQLQEFVSTEIRHENDKKYAGTKKTINLLGMELEGEYTHTRMDSLEKSVLVTYRVNSDLEFEMNTNGDLIGFYVYYFPEEYEMKTEKITYDESIDVAVDYLKNTVKVPNLDEYSIEKYSNFDGTYSYLYFARYVNSIRMHVYRFEVDTCGNIASMLTTEVNRWGDIKVPNFDDEVYVEMAKKRIKERYAENYPDKKIKELKDCNVDPLSYKSMRYIESEQSNAVEFRVYGTIVFEDGTEGTFGNEFYYLLDGSSKVVREN